MADGGTAMFAGPVTFPIGIYSGRINDQSDLGMVWKCAAIRELIAHARDPIRRTKRWTRSRRSRRF
jgi:hypothetical protein